MDSIIYFREYLMILSIMSSLFSDPRKLNSLHCSQAVRANQRETKD